MKDERLNGSFTAYWETELPHLWSDRRREPCWFHRTAGKLKEERRKLQLLYRKIKEWEHLLKKRTWWERVAEAVEWSGGGGGDSDQESRSAVEVWGFLTGVFLSIFFIFLLIQRRVKRFLETLLQCKDIFFYFKSEKKKKVEMRD